MVSQVVRDLPVDAGSDQRLQAVLDRLAKRGVSEARAAERKLAKGTTVKSTKSSVTVTIKRAGDSKDFADWIDANIDRLIKDSFQAFKNEAGR